MLMGRLCVLVGMLAVLLRRHGMDFRLFMLTYVVMMGGLKVVMCCCLMMCCSSVMVLT